MATSLHPVQPNFQAEMRARLPADVAGYLSGLAAASSANWPEGGLTIQNIALGAPSSWTPSAPSSRELLLELFACICGNNASDRTSEAAPALDGFIKAVQLAFPLMDVHLEVEDGYEVGWCYTLRVVVGSPQSPACSFALFWSID